MRFNFRFLSIRRLFRALGMHSTHTTPNASLWSECELRKIASARSEHTCVRVSARARDRVDIFMYVRLLWHFFFLSLCFFALLSIRRSQYIGERTCTTLIPRAEWLYHMQMHYLFDFAQRKRKTHTHTGTRAPAHCRTECTIASLE